MTPRPALMTALVCVCCLWPVPAPAGPARRVKSAAPLGPRLVQVNPPPLPAGAACDDLRADRLAQAIERELPALDPPAEVSPARPGAARPVVYSFGKRRVTPPEYARGTLVPLLKLAQRGPQALCRELTRRFLFFRPTAPGPQAPGKFTAYNHPEFHGSRQRGGPYQHPLYRRPPDERAGLTTAQILSGGLDGGGLELLYLDDPTAVWTTHIEGSARVVLAEGGAINVTTDGHNGGAYRNVSKLVLADKKIPRDQVTPPGMTRVRKYFLDHPDELLLYWAQNPHYVFFKETPLSGTGRFGELVPGRSLAADLRHVPLGAALWLWGQQDPPLLRLGLAQDTGAAILGPERIDIFFGGGEAAQLAATSMNTPGRVYVLLGQPPKQKHKGTRRTSGLTPAAMRVTREP